MQPSNRLLILVLAVGGCATDSVDDPPLPPPPVDATGPSVVAVSPTDQAADVASGSRLVVTFSEPIDPATVDPRWIHLTIGNYQVPVTLAVGNGNTLDVSPLVGLGAHTAYRLTVTSIADLDGHVMKPFASQFTTKAGSVQTTDPTADTFGAGTFQPDLTSLTASTSASAVTITLQFDQPIAPSSLGGYIDLDLDQNAATGGLPLTDQFRGGAGSTGMGAEAMVQLFQNSDGTMSIFDGAGGGTVTPTFTATSVSLAIPLAMIGNDDGNLNLAAVVGSLAEPTDIIPNDLHIQLGAPGGGCSASSSTEALRFSALGSRWQRN